jgi:hypothetical protein
VFYHPASVPDTLDEILTLARLYLSEGDAARLTVWLAHRQGRNPALAGDRPEIERLEHIARHWLTEDERLALVRWMHLRAARGEPLVPERTIGRPERRKE